MRVLFTCGAEYGHLHSLLPLARSLVERDHEVVFALPDSFRIRAETAGFATLPVGLDREAVARELNLRFPEWRDVPADGLLEFALVTIGGRVMAPAMVRGLVPAITSFGADLLVHGPAVLGGPIAAAATGIPSVNHGWGPLLGLRELDLAANAVAPLWEEYSLAPEPRGGMFRYLYLDVCPPSLQTPEIATIATASPLRPVPADGVGGEALPGWVESLPDRPTVYVSLGTFCNRFTHLFLTILAGLRDAPVNVVVTVGYDQDPAALGPQPAHVHVARYIPTSQVVPRCRLVVSHGGSATVLAALRSGVPLLLVPQGHDQLKNAERCAAIGVGRWLKAEEFTAEAVSEAVRDVLGDPAYELAARAVQQEFEAMPGPEEVVGVLEALARDHTPLDRAPGG
ncbi:MAG TPA: glycosyltransferase [Acidimicrobiales bacterium]|nr:glycosyltransferase [Acidimicrobiales bacterium]